MRRTVCRRWIKTLGKQRITAVLYAGVCLLVIASACEFRPTVAPLPTAAPSPTQVPATDVPEPPPIPEVTAVPSPTPLPTYTPAAAPQAIPTHDPTLAEWTVMVYLDADNNLEASGLIDFNEMEAAGESGKVNVLVQIDRAVGETAADEDWTGVRRYRIRADKDPIAVGSELVATLGELNMGDPRVLADFIAWGIRSYPANRYTLILWDHGAGWNGIAFDEETADSGDDARITLADLDLALTQGLQEGGLDRLDLVAFDACLMGQLDVFQTLQPHARYAVGSEELTPGQGWDYEAVLRQWVADPGRDGRQLASQMASDFVTYYSQTEPEDFVTMAAVDLAQVPRVSYALEQLAAVLMDDPAFVVSAVGDARSGAEAYARVYADEFERYAAIDLHHFASILAQRTPNEWVAAAAEDVMRAIESAVIANEHGAGFKNSGGMAVYFPRTAEFYASSYAQVTTNQTWNAFLNSYHAAGQAHVPPPEVHLVSVLSETVSVQQPAYLDFEIIGRDIVDVSLVGGRYEPDGRQRLLEFDRLIPEPTYLPDGSQLIEWRDGVHEDFFVWNTKVTYLYDAAGNGDFVVMWPTESGTSLFTVQGRYQRADGGPTFDANLAFDHDTGRLDRVWVFQSDESAAPAELTPQPDDEFQVYNLFWQPDGRVEREPGPRLFFDEARQLYYDWRPLPDGRYFLGFVAENVAGETADAFTDLMIDNSGTQPGYAAYLDPYLGFRFLYPETWYAPVYTGTLLYTADLSGMLQMQISTFPNLDAGVDAAALKAETLKQFGAVDILFEDEVALDGIRGLRTVYGYDKAGEGPYTGIFFTVVKNGTGFVVDVEGRSADEAKTIAAVETMTASWTFLPIGFGLRPGAWATIDLDAFTVAQPADFIYQEVDGWQRFSSDGFTFVALRTQPATISVEGVLAALIRDAGAGVSEFTAGEPFRFPLGGAVWERADFRYMARDGREIWGFIMVKVEAGQEVVAWAEAPATTYNELESPIFLTMISDMSLANGASPRLNP